MWWFAHPHSPKVVRGDRLPRPAGAAGPVLRAYRQLHQRGVVGASYRPARGDLPQLDELPRHPSQLYEAALEGVVLFLILWFFSRRPRTERALYRLFLLGYGVLRSLVEFTREPDNFLDC